MTAPLSSQARLLAVIEALAGNEVIGLPIDQIWPPTNQILLRRSREEIEAARTARLVAAA
jgi:hypothetical protein